MRAIYKFTYEFTRFSPLLVLALALTVTRSVPSFAQDATAVAGNHPAYAETEAPTGGRAADAQLTMAVTLQLRNRAGAERLLAQIQDPKSPNYHQWLTSAEFAARFDPTQADVDAVVDWLAGEGFTILSSSRSQRLIRFTGTVAQAQQAFRTTIYNFGAGKAFGNVDDPVIPAGFAGVIAHIHGLDNMVAAKATSRFIPSFSKTPAGAQPSRAAGSPKVYAALSRDGSANDAAPAGASPDAIIDFEESFAPADFLTFYDETPLANAGINGGSGDCIAIVGDSDFEQSSVDTFNSSFSEPASSITTVVVNGSDPGFNGDEVEALLDLEWSHAVAPGAATRYYVGNSEAPVIAPVVDEINAAVNDNQCGVISVSFSLCGASGGFFTGTVSPIYVQAALQKQSIFIAEGDQGAAGLTYNPFEGCIAASTRNVNELSTDPNITAVGGVSFNPSFNGAGNDTSVVTSTTLRVWDDPNDGIPSGGAGGGGASAYYTKPSYQTGLGVPADGQRDVPDVSTNCEPEFSRRLHLHGRRLFHFRLRRRRRPYRRNYWRNQPLGAFLGGDRQAHSAEEWRHATRPPQSRALSAREFSQLRDGFRGRHYRQQQFQRRYRLCGRPWLRSRHRLGQRQHQRTGHLVPFERDSAGAGHADAIAQDDTRFRQSRLRGRGLGQQGQDVNHHQSGEV